MDDLSFEQLCEKNRDVIRSVIEARLDPAILQRVDPSDVVQDTFLEAHTRLADFLTRRPMPIEAWLRETAIQQVRIARRRHRHTASRSVLRQISFEQSSVHRLAEQVTAVDVTAEELCSRAEQQQQTWNAIQQLSNHDREILLLRYVNGLSNADAAKVLAVNEPVASKRHCRALLRLQTKLQSMNG